MNELLEKARIDYPIGTKIRCVMTGIKQISTGIYWKQDEDIYILDGQSKWCIYNSIENQWAEIIKEETMFKKGDYIVTLINDGDCGKVNYCSKQTIDNEYLRPEFDTKGCTDNGNSTFDFSDKSGSKWRFATKEEGEEYERQGKPYDVTKDNMTQQEFNSLKVGETLGEWEILHKFKELLIIEDKRGYDLVDLAKINKLGLKVTPKTFMGLEIKKYDNVPCEMDCNQLYYLLDVNKDSILCSIRKNGCVLCCVPISIRIL